MEGFLGVKLGQHPSYMTGVHVVGLHPSQGVCPSSVCAPATALGGLVHVHVGPWGCLAAGHSVR